MKKYKKNPAPVFFTELEFLVNKKIEVRLVDDYYGKLFAKGLLQKIGNGSYTIESYTKLNSYYLIKFNRFQILKIVDNIIHLKPQTYSKPESIYDFNLIKKLFTDFKEFVIITNNNNPDNLNIFLRLKNRIRYNKEYHIFYINTLDFSLIFSHNHIKKIIFPWENLSRFLYPEIEIEI